MKKLSRRDFVSASALAGASALIAGAAEEQRLAAQGRSGNPNILVILTDQHRLDCLGVYGNADIHTPHFDSLATDGVRFTNSFCPYPVCTPSRYSLVSGLYVHEHRGWNNHCTLPPDVESFPAVLKKAGYRTKAVGKMHYTPTYLDVGFSEMVLAEQNGPGRWDDDYHRDLRTHDLIDGNDLEDQETVYRGQARPDYWETFGAIPSDLPNAFHSTEWIGDKANETLKSWGASNEMLVASFIKPHHPFDPPAHYCDFYDPTKLTVLPGWTEECLERDQNVSKGYFDHTTLTETALRRIMVHYYAAIQHIDDQVGKLIQTLKDKHLYDNTLIVFTSDHGEYLGFHHLLLKGNYMYDPLMKVPLIVKFPGNTRKGTVSSAMVNTTDIAPTILAQAGCTVPKAMRGLNLSDDKLERKVTFADGHEGRQVMARTATHKLILDRVKGVNQFYDLEKDPLELENRFADPAYQDDVATLTSALGAWRDLNATAKAYLNEDAPTIDRPNVPDREDSHRHEMMEYTRQKMQARSQAAEKA